MEFYPKNKLHIGEVKKFIIIFYLVGIVGFLIPFSHQIFISITPLALVLSTYLLAVYHRKYNYKAIFVFMSVFLAGFCIEIIGVKTGVIFGNYTYGNTLGTKLLETPVIIGVNWLFLTYTSISIVQKIFKTHILIIISAPLLMLIYDLILEQVAPKIDMWSWQNSIIPIQNYIAWYLIAFCFVVLFQLVKIETKNPLALVLFVCQFVFFTILSIFL